MAYGVYALHTVAIIVGIVGVATVIGRFVGSLLSLLAVTGDSRLLVLTGELLALMKRREQMRNADCPFVFHRRDEFIRDFRKAWAHATEAAGCSGRVFHSLRRSSVRDMIRTGVHERVAMSVSGPKTRSVFDRYNTTAEDDIRQALARTQKYREEAIRELSNDTQ